MRFGLWDHVDKSGRPFEVQLDERLEFLAAGDAAGFHCFHVAEHHATPLNLVPVPGVYLGAVARITKRIRLGPLCYLLPLYSPLRLIEEVAILDNLSHGRLEIGVGRGVSPFELNYHNVDPETSREVFREALEVLIKGLTSERLDHKGKRFTYADVPMEIRPVQRPHPPIWYPSSNEAGGAWAGERGYNFVTLGGIELARKNIAAFRAAFARHNTPHVRSPAFAEGVAVGVNRHMVIADTDARALEIARPAHRMYNASLTKLWRENKATTAVAYHAVPEVEEAMKSGAAIVGSPDTVAREIKRQIEVLGINYMICGFVFGDMPAAHAMHSLALFKSEVMPRFA